MTAQNPKNLIDSTGAKCTSTVLTKMSGANILKSVERWSVFVHSAEFIAEEYL